MNEDLGAPRQFSTADVAEQLKEPETTVRYWATELSAFLGSHREGRNRRFTMSQIAILKQVQTLRRDKHMTMPQIKAYLSALADKGTASDPGDAGGILLRYVTELVENELTSFEILFRKHYLSDWEQSLEMRLEQERKSIMAAVRDEVAALMARRDKEIYDNVYREFKARLWGQRFRQVIGRFRKQK